jgi:hypothetical protein
VLFFCDLSGAETSRSPDREDEGDFNKVCVLACRLGWKTVTPNPYLICFRPLISKKVAGPTVLKILPSAMSRERALEENA